jgi:GTP pyrophosphokinase
LDDPQPNAVDFLNTIKLNLYASEIFVVTPKGDFKTMPAGSTVLDFAFSIHTFLGTHCIGAKVNHKLEGLGYHLESGDQVEILTGKQNRVSKEWLDYATTAKARSKITSMLKRNDRELQRVGKERLAALFEELDIERNSYLEDRLCELHGVRLREELYQAIGSGSIVLDKDDRNIILGKKHRNWLRHLPLIGRKKKGMGQTAQTVVLQVEVQADDADDVVRELEKMGLKAVKKLT